MMRRRIRGYSGTLVLFALWMLSCADTESLDRCADGNHGCDPNADCVDTADGFMCVCRITEGYVGDGSTCGNVDECADPALHDCDTEPSACLDRLPTSGRYTCRCPDGWTGEGIGADGCRDVNECAAPLAYCDTDPPAPCINMEGRAACLCPFGSIGDGVGSQGCMPLPDDIDVGVGPLPFNPEVADYAVDVGVLRAFIDVTVTIPAGPFVTLNGRPISSGEAARVPLSVGVNVVEVDVTMGAKSRTYTLTVTRDSLVERYLEASEPGENDEFGRSVSSSRDGNTIAIGARYEDSSTMGINSTPNELARDSGAVYVFRRSNGIWSQEAYIKSSTTTSGDHFGHSISLSADGNTLAVGAPREEPGANLNLNSGVAYVFQRVNGRWRQSARLTAFFQLEDELFGFSVSLSGDGNTLAVGNDLGGRFDTGRVTVFTRSFGQWDREASFRPVNRDDNDGFGTSVSLSEDGNTLAVGAPGEDSGFDSLPDNNDAFESGAAYVFARSDGVWNQTAYIKASNVGRGDQFGHSVSLSGDGHALAVGAPGEDSSTTGIDSVPNDEAPNSGAVYTFTRSGALWSPFAYLKASLSTPGDSFGRAVSLSRNGDTLAVGALGENSSTTGVDSVPNDEASNSGAVYVFTRLGGLWSQSAYVKASMPEAFDRLATSVSMSGDGRIVTVGVRGRASSEAGLASAGSAYMFELVPD